MGLLAHILAALVNLLLVAVDLAILLIAVRWLCRARQYRWASTIDTAAAPWVDMVLLKADRWWARIQPARALSVSGKLFFVTGMLLMLRLALVTAWLVLR